MMYPSNVVATAISYGVGSGETDLPVEDGSTYPDPTAVGMESYKVLVGYGTSREEVCLVTSKPTANTLRVTRGYDSSPATAKNTGDVVVPGLTAVDATTFAAMLPKAGGTMTGPIVLAGNPSTSNQAANKSYVDAKAVLVYRQGSAPSSPKEGDLWVKDYTSGLVDKAPSDVLTNAARWAWAGFGYNAGTSFVAEAGGMRLNFAAGVSNSAGCVGSLGLVAGRSYRLEALLEVPVGSNPVRLIETFVGTSGYAAAGATTRLVMDAPYTTTSLLGINADGTASGGSVLVKEFHVYDVTDAMPETRVWDDVNGWCQIRDGWSWRAFLPIGGGTLTGAVTLAADPTSALHPTSKQYVDTADGALLPKAGGTMTGAITLAADPAAAMQPASKQYADALSENRVWANAVRTGQSLSAGTWTQMTSWTLTQYGGVTQGSGTLTVPAGLYLVTARTKTGAAGRLIAAVENGDASYGSTAAWLCDARAATASDVVAGSRLIYTSGSLKLWAFVGSATTVDMYVDVVRLGGQNAA